MKRDLLATILVLMFGFGCVYSLSLYLEHNRITIPESYDDEDLALQAKKLKGFALGTEGLLSDWYWMRSLQYIGGKFVKQGPGELNLDDLRPLNPRLLYPMLDIATELDPKSMAPFSFGATMLPAIDTNHAIALTEKGIARNPDNWRLHQYLGYIYWKTKNYERAAEVYDAGAKIPGAPPFFRMMAGRIRTESGSRDVAREIYKQSAAEAPDESSKMAAEIRLMELDSLDERDAINAALREHQKRTGSCPRRWSEILPKLANVQLPNNREFLINEKDEIVDPSGVPYLLDATCQARIDASKSKIPPQ